MPSVRRNSQLAVLVLGGVFAVGSFAGCQTTQEKAEAQRAESARILKQREKRQAKKQQRKHEKEKG